MEAIAIGAIIGIVTCAGCMLCIVRKSIPTLKVSRSSDHLSAMDSEDLEPISFSSKPKSEPTNFGS
jgi:hypothetical protein